MSDFRWRPASFTVRAEDAPNWFLCLCAAQQRVSRVIQLRRCGGDAARRSRLVAWVSLTNCRHPSRNLLGRILRGNRRRRSFLASYRSRLCSWGGPGRPPWRSQGYRPSLPDSRSSSPHASGPALAASRGQHARCAVGPGRGPAVLPPWAAAPRWRQGDRPPQRPGARPRLRTDGADPAAVPRRRRSALSFLAVVGVATAAAWAAGVRLRVGHVRDRRSAGRHRGTADPRRGAPWCPATARKRGLTTDPQPSASSGSRFSHDLHCAR
jgi:hypothetical protein